MLHVVTLPDTDALAEAAAEHVVDLLRDALDRKDRASLVLTGGGTPKPMYERLASKHADDVDWKRVDVFFGDDRFVPPDHEESNHRLARKHLLSDGPISDCNVYPVPTTMDEPGDAALAYEETLRAYFAGEEPLFDVMLLGMGDDGHIASLYPGEDSLEEEDRWVLHTHAPEDQPVRDRVTMTIPLLNASDQVVFLVAGEEKAEAVAWTFGYEGEGETPPATLVEGHQQTTWFLDEAAAAEADL